MPFSKGSNLVIIFETLHGSLSNDLGKAMQDLGETWNETKETFENFKIATKEALRVRGDSARKIEEKKFWKHEYEKELEEKERIMKELLDATKEVNRMKEDRKIKNESILAHNNLLIQQLQEEQKSHIRLLEEIIDDKSLLNQMSNQKRREKLQEQLQKVMEDYERLCATTEKRNLRSFDTKTANKSSNV